MTVSTYNTTFTNETLTPPSRPALNWNPQGKRKKQLTTVNGGREERGRLQLATVRRDSDRTERDGEASIRSYAPDEVGEGGKGGRGVV